MFTNFYKAFKNHNKYNQCYCKECHNIEKCISNNIILKYSDGTYQPANNHSYFRNYGCNILKG